jgi:hypothetical protein
MVNKGKERRVYSNASNSSLVDSTGKSYPGSKVDLGESPREKALSTIAPGIDVSVGITFENVSGSIVKAQLLNLSIGDHQKGSSPVQFRNISISN